MKDDGGRVRSDPRHGSDRAKDVPPVTMSDEADLIARLGSLNPLPSVATCLEAIQTIERLVKERDEARYELKKSRDRHYELLAGTSPINKGADREQTLKNVSALAAQVEELRAGLNEICDADGTLGGPVMGAIVRGRALLARTAPPPETAPSLATGNESGGNASRGTTREVAREWLVGWFKDDPTDEDIAALVALLDSQREPLLAQIAEANERVEAFEDAVRENLPEVTGDADGNLETNEICRIETVGLLYKEQAKAIAENDARIAMLRDNLWGAGDTLRSARNNVQTFGTTDPMLLPAMQSRERLIDAALAETADAQAWLDGKLAEERERTRRDCQEIANHMLGNPSPDAFPNIKDGRSWNAACIRIEAAIRALGPRTGET